MSQSMKQQIINNYPANKKHLIEAAFEVAADFIQTDRAPEYNIEFLSDTLDAIFPGEFTQSELYDISIQTLINE